MKTNFFSLKQLGNAGDVADVRMNSTDGQNRVLRRELRLVRMNVRKTVSDCDDDSSVSSGTDSDSDYDNSENEYSNSSEEESPLTNQQQRIEKTPRQNTFKELLTDLCSKRDYLEEIYNSLPAKTAWRIARRIVVPIVCANAFSENGDAKLCRKQAIALCKHRTLYRYVTDACAMKIDLFPSRLGIRPACEEQYHWFYDCVYVQEKFLSLAIEKFTSLVKQSMRVKHLRDLINNDLLPWAIENEYALEDTPQIKRETARKWSAMVGILYKDYKAQLPYFLGHSRPDVVLEREAFVSAWLAFWLHVDHVTDKDEFVAGIPVPANTDNEHLKTFVGKKIAIFAQDESTFKPKDSAAKGMLPPNSYRMMPKSQGQAIMISDFVSTLPGNEKVTVVNDDHRCRAAELLGRACLRDSAKLTLDYKKEGYFDSAKFQNYFDETCAIIR